MGQSRGYFSSRALCFIIIFFRLPWWFRVVVKNLPARQETQVRFLCQEDPLEKGMATHSSTLAWRIPWTEEPGRLQSIGLQGQTQLSDWYPNTHTHTHTHFLHHTQVTLQRRPHRWAYTRENNSTVHDTNDCICCFCLHWWDQKLEDFPSQVPSTRETNDDRGLKCCRWCLLPMLTLLLCEFLWNSVWITEW